MRFMIIVKSNSSNCAATALPDTDFVAAMQKFNNELSAAGVLLALPAGLLFALRSLAEAHRTAAGLGG